MRLDLFTHIIILVLHLEQGCAFAILAVDEVDAFLHICLLLLVKIHIVVADDI